MSTATTSRFTADDQLKLTNLGKVFWPEVGYTKGDLLDYYREIAPVILPYLTDRPQVLHRQLTVMRGRSFFSVSPGSARLGCRSFELRRTGESVGGR